MRQTFHQYLTGCSVGFAVAWTLVGAMGCGGSNPATFEVTGEVTYQGQPVDGAQVTFVADEGRPAIATTNTQGQFTLRSYGENDGAVIGQHRVTIVKNVPQPASPDNPYPPLENLLPMKYARAETSGLIAEVTKDGENNFHFDLAD